MPPVARASSTLKLARSSLSPSPPPTAAPTASTPTPPRSASSVQTPKRSAKSSRLQAYSIKQTPSPKVIRLSPTSCLRWNDSRSRHRHHCFHHTRFRQQILRNSHGQLSQLTAVRNTRLRIDLAVLDQS